MVMPNDDEMMRVMGGGRGMPGKSEAPPAEPAAGPEEATIKCPKCGADINLTASAAGGGETEGAQE